MRITNEVLKEYLDIKEQIKALEERAGEIKSTIIQINGAQTSDYVAAIRLQDRRQVASIKVFEQKLGKTWLDENQLVSIVTAIYVDVVPKPKRAE